MMKLRDFSYFDQLMTKQVPRLTVFPKSHYVTPRETILATLDAIKEELRERLDYLKKNNRLVEAQRLDNEHALIWR